jgi:mono/diheme cytochrome c family protein
MFPLVTVRLAAAMMCLLLCVSGSAKAEDYVGQLSMISLGGRLYDNHWTVIDRSPPAGTNPVYPAGLEVAPAETWRCVACHGWDYRGRDGHLGSVASSAAFASLRPSIGKSPKDIIASLKTASHADLVAKLPDHELEALSMFISVGQHDTSQDLVNGKSTGNALRGKDIFEGACVSCHQADGKAYIVGEAGDESSLGWVAMHRPEQALHKIKNGVPGADMLSLRFLKQEQLLDLLAYLQSLEN